MTKELELQLKKSEVLLLYRLLLAQALMEDPTPAQWKSLERITENVEKVIYDSEKHYPVKHGG